MRKIRITESQYKRFQELDADLDESGFAEKHFSDSYDKRVNRDEFSVTYMPSKQSDIVRDIGTAKLPAELKSTIDAKCNEILNHIWPNGKKFFILVGVAPVRPEDVNYNKGMEKYKSSLYYQRSKDDENVADGKPAPIPHNAYYAIVKNNVLTTVVPYPLNYDVSRIDEAPDVVVKDLEGFMERNKLRKDDTNVFYISNGIIKKRNPEEMADLKSKNSLVGKLKKLIGTTIMLPGHDEMSFTIQKPEMSQGMALVGVFEFLGAEYHGIVTYGMKDMELDFRNKENEDLKAAEHDYMGEIRSFFLDVLNYLRENK